MTARILIARKELSILLVNYKTPRLTSLCLSLLYKKFDLSLVDIIVVDNDSADESVSYLRSLNWIQLIERRVTATEKCHVAHAQALDLGIQHIYSEFVLIIHTDTFIYNSKIVDIMLRLIREHKDVACVGTNHQRFRKMHKRVWRTLKKVTSYYCQGLSYLLGFSDTAPVAFVDRYLKSFCCLWDVDIIKNFGLRFCAEDRNPGYTMQDQLAGLKFNKVIISAKLIFQHLSHVQSGSNAEIGVYNKDHRRAIAFNQLVELHTVKSGAEQEPTLRSEEKFTA